VALFCVAVQNYQHNIRSNLKKRLFLLRCSLDMDSFTTLTFLGPFSDHICSENIWKGKMKLDNCIAPDVIDTDLEGSFYFNVTFLEAVFILSFGIWIWIPLQCWHSVDLSLIIFVLKIYEKGKMELDNCIVPEVIDTDLESSFHFTLLIIITFSEAVFILAFWIWIWIPLQHWHSLDI